MSCCPVFQIQHQLHPASHSSCGLHTAGAGFSVPPLHTHHGNTAHLCEHTAGQAALRDVRRITHTKVRRCPDGTCSGGHIPQTGNDCGGLRKGKPGRPGFWASPEKGVQTWQLPPQGQGQARRCD